MFAYKISVYLKEGKSVICNIVANSLQRRPVGLVNLVNLLQQLILLFFGSLSFTSCLGVSFLGSTQMALCAVTHITYKSRIRKDLTVAPDEQRWFLSG